MEDDSKKHEVSGVDPDQLETANALISRLVMILDYLVYESEFERKAFSAQVRAIQELLHQMESGPFESAFGDVWEHANNLSLSIHSLAETPYPPKVEGLVEEIKLLISRKARINRDKQERNASRAGEIYEANKKKLRAAIEAFNKAYNPSE